MQNWRAYLSIFLACAVEAQLPQDPTVIAGDVSFHEADQQLTIQQNTAQAIVNWREFSISSGHTVDIRQPNASSVSLHRVVGKDPSRLAGTLRSNGTVFLVNRNGIAFADGARVDIHGGFLGTTQDIADEAFLRADYRFRGTSEASIVLEGRIERASPGKWMALVARDVDHKGTLLAVSGHHTILAGAESFVVDLDGDNLLSFAVDREKASQSLSVQLAASGAIQGEDHHVLLTTQDTAATTRNVINMDGVIEANRVDVAKDGTIALLGGAHSTVTVNGTLRSQGKHGKGGTIRATGSTLVVSKDARIDVSGKTGGGKVFVGADIRGKSMTFARDTSVEAGAEVHADALDNGHGGHIDFWGTERLMVKGNASAQGGLIGGDGGFIETSTKAILDIEGARFTTAAPRGKTGTFLIDPINIVITSATDPLPALTTALHPDAITSALATNNVVITTNGTFDGIADPGGDHDGDNSNKNILITSAWTVSSDNDLTLEAGSRISVHANVVFSGRGNLFLRAGLADDTATGTLNFTVGGTLRHEGYAMVPDESGKIYIYYNTANVDSPQTVFTPSIGTSNFVAYRWIKNDVDWSRVRDGWVANSTSSSSYALRDNLTLDHSHVLPATSMNPYTGSFDGNGKTITILRGVGQEGQFPSLFPVVRYAISGAELANIRNVTINFGNYNGGLADVAPLVGNLERGRVSDNFITIGTISTTGDCVGGVVARVTAADGQDTEISRNQVTFTEIHGGDYTGGIIGVNSNSHEVRILDNEVSGGDLTGGVYVGGVQGDGQSTLDGNQIVLSTITGSDYVGGIAGRKGNGDMDSNSAIIGTITAAMNYVGGIVGEIVEGSTATGNIVDVDHISGTNYVGGGFGSIGLAGTFSNSIEVDLIEAMNGVGGIAGAIVNGGASIGDEVGTVRIRANGSAVGGLVGAINEGTLQSGRGSPYIIQVNPMGQGTGGMIGYVQEGTIQSSSVAGVVIVPTAGKVGGLFGYVNDLALVTLIGVNQWNRSVTPLAEVDFNQQTPLSDNSFKRATHHIGDGDGSAESDNSQETWILGVGRMKYVPSDDDVFIDITELIPPVDDALVESQLEQANFANQVDVYTPLDDFAGEVGGGGGSSSQEEVITTNPNNQQPRNP